MAEDRQLTDPRRFGLSSFAELLAPRVQIIGEDPRTYEAVHAGLMASLVPMTPYECVIAENLISIEWELIQHRQMREAKLRELVASSVVRAIVDAKFFEHSLALDEAWEQHVASGGTEDDWEEPISFDRNSAKHEGKALVDRAMSPDIEERSQAYDELKSMEIDLIGIMSSAYIPTELLADKTAQKHADAVVALENRRREVKRDFDLLQKSRPIEGEVIDG